MRMLPAHCTRGSRITARGLCVVPLQGLLHVREHLAGVGFPALARFARKAIRARHRDHIHEQGLVGLFIELHVAHRQRTQGLAVIAVAQGDEAGLLRLPRFFQ